MTPPCSSTLVDATGALCICCFLTIMASGLYQCLTKRSGGLLLPCPLAMAQVRSRWLANRSSPGGLSAFQVKPRTLKDLPHVSFLEMMYRMIFQGFYKRLHELQVGQQQYTALHRLCLSQIYTFTIHLISVGAMLPLFNLLPKICTGCFVHSRNP